MEAVLYIGHGTRVPEGNAQLKAFCEEAMDAVDVPIQEVCYLELADPDIEAGVRRAVERGATVLHVVPVLLFKAGHAKADIPEELARVKQLYPGVMFTYGEPFGLHEAIYPVLKRRLQEAGWQEGEAADVLFVGRGSSDTEAIGEFYELSARLKEELGLERVAPCFLAAVTPAYRQGLEAEVHRTNNRSLYVLPYLLFTGLLMKEMKETIEEVAAERDVQLAPYLGFDHALTVILRERVEALRACLQVG
ncbi:sirohydrochlorin chelatase [Salsuginibacillus kocurii]|uniref:sirohydrochlorin chelatase n=1 Tax=Salsuginibacillus kocurii TaxID=427078 RepID=UPI00036E02AC|nr:sirohydrochlorin chelatase [Salsuginibacillus kocurii]